VRKIYVPFVGRYIGAFYEIAQVTEIALVYNFAVVGDSNTVDLHGVASIHQVKQYREGIAETDTAATAMTNVIDPFQLLIEISFVPEPGLVLMQRVSGGCVQTSFSTFIGH
jgi:hypothetical protein